MMRRSLLSTVFLMFALSGCGQEKDINSEEGIRLTESLIVSENSSAKASSAETSTELAKKLRYYCNQTVAQIQADTKSVGTCDASGYGHRTDEQKDWGRLWPERNEASIKVTSPSLEAIGLEVFSFSANQGIGKPPRLKIGVFIMDQAPLKTMPSNKARGTSFSNSSTYYTVNTADAKALHEKIPRSELTGYEITSAVLTIDYVEDIETEEIPGAISGTQYARGNISISLVPLGLKGDTFSGTFEFGTQVDWGIFKG
mgnify:CR=1 FL=1